MAFYHNLPIFSNVFKLNTDNSDDKFLAELGSLLSEHMQSAAPSVPRIDAIDKYSWAVLRDGRLRA